MIQVLLNAEAVKYGWGAFPEKPLLHICITHIWKLYLAHDKLLNPCIKN